MRQKNNSIALVGEWNTSNIGDKAIGIKAVRYLLSLGFDVKLFALGSFRYLGHVATTRQLDELFSPTISAGQVDGVGQKLLKFGHRHFPRSKFVFRFFRNYANRQSIRAEFVSCNAVLVGGGALLDDNGLHFPSSLLLIQKICRDLSLPLFSVGCSSSGNFSMAGKYILRKFVNYAQLVAVRDRESKRALQPLSKKDIFIFGDFALGMDLQEEGKTFVPPRSIAINVMHFAGSEKHLQHDYELFLKAVINFLRRRNFTVTLFTTGDQNDLRAAQAVHSMTGQFSTIFHPRTFQEIVSFLQTKDAVFCTRLHAAIMAIDANVPAIALWVTPKIKNFFETIGLSEYCIEASSGIDVNNSIADVLDTKLASYFRLLTFQYFEPGRQRVSEALEKLRDEITIPYNK